MFRAAVMRRLFPYAETLYILLFIVLYIISITQFSLRMGRQLSKQTNALLDVTDSIAAQDLDVDIPQNSGFFEMDRLLASLDFMRCALRESLKTQWRIEQERTEQLASLVHDLKTPLTIIRGNAELLQESGLNDQQSQYGAYILHSVERIDNYAAQLREAVHAGGTAIDRRPCEVSIIWEDITAALTTMASIKGITIKVIGECPRVRIDADQETLARAFWNLFDNAVRQTPEAGTIALRIAVWKSSILITVEDSGPGFDPDTLSNIGAPLTLDAYHVTGHGLGMYIAKRIIECHGGELTIRNIGQSGAAVDVALPILEYIQYGRKPNDPGA
ncbi:hypothetical protein AGMMS49992_28760 [Clostridia bacterium]|nr:hypothetical protein AGMMS49992_28760 [Clostridia bacterium]